jgi:hypothetical protein
MMGQYAFEGVGIPVRDEQTIEGFRRQVLDITEEAKLESWSRGLHSCCRAYQRATGRKLPLIYRLKIHVEIESLPEDEIEAMWKNGSKVFSDG